MKHFVRTYFLAGALVLAPIAVTIWILKAIILWCEDLFHSFIPWHPTIFGIGVPGVGLIFTILLICLTGMLTKHYLGRQVILFGESILHKIPLGRGIYISIKQLFLAIFGGEREKFRQVVVVEFPRKGSYMLGFVTAETSANLQEILKGPHLNVFVPTSPNPTSGFLLIVEPQYAIPVAISTDQALKLIVSGGPIHS
ncbi:MAG: DUF502 domain-containing protein [Deltaproteobacteria bacterium]|nr:DUF502 domain-containing protein [Deltaproteobacteria bacterium]